MTTKKTVSIHIGEYHASKNPVIIRTLLGSCVSVCLFDTKNKIGGMNHILLPGESDFSRFDAAARYGINAMELLINRMMKMGANRKFFIAKAFGGANVLPMIHESKAVGQKISEFVTKFLETDNIPLVKHDFGGTDTRKIYFHTDTGDVYLKRLNNARIRQIMIDETRKRLKKQADQDLKKAGDIDLFDI